MSDIHNKESDKETLIAIFHDMSENIDYTKKRSFALLVAYSAICAFLINEKTTATNDKTIVAMMHWPVLSLLLIGLVLFSLLIFDNYDRIKVRRSVLLKILEEFKLSDGVRAKVDALKDKGTLDCLIFPAQILYLISIYELTSSFLFP